MATAGKDICSLSIRAFRKKTLSSTIKILNFFIAFELEFEETISPLLSYIFPLQCHGNKWGECCIRGREWQYFKDNFPKCDMNDFGRNVVGWSKNVKTILQERLSKKSPSRFLGEMQKKWLRRMLHNQRSNNYEGS
jgi:hypothetical protein